MIAMGHHGYGWRSHLWQEQKKDLHKKKSEIMDFHYVEVAKDVGRIPKVGEYIELGTVS